MTGALLPLAVVVLVASVTQAMTGFGSIVIALTLGALFLPIPELLPVLVALNLPLCAVVAWRERLHVDVPLLVRAILPLMTVGVLAGIGIAPWLEGPALRRGFGVLVTVTALYQLWKLAFSGASERREVQGRRASLRSRILLLGAGITHGIWASGGPLLVMALGNLSLSRARFRATLTWVWLIFNVVLLAAQLWNGDWDRVAVLRTTVLLPLIPISQVLGELLHHRVPEAGFRAVVQGVLVFAGLALLR